MFRVKIEGIAGVKAQFAAATKEMVAVIESEVESMGQEWVNQAKRDAPADQGTLRQGISYLKSGNGVEIVSNAFYSPFMEFGTRGNYRPIPGTEAIAAQFRGYKGRDIGGLIKAIKAWVRRKGIGATMTKSGRPSRSKASTSNQDRVAFLIAMSILKRGVRPHPFFFKQQEVVWPKMIRNIQRRLKQSMKVHVEYPGSRSKQPIITI